MWRRWKREGCERAKEEHRRLHKDIKYKVRKAKKASFDKCRRQRRVDQSAAVKRIAPAEFTDFVASQHGKRVGERILQCRTFEVADDWRAEIEAAVRRGTRRKATGNDELFVEALQVRPELAEEWLWRLWRRCGQIGAIPRAWTESVLCPLLKKQPANVPGNWRAVALLSHARKVIEKVLDLRLRAEYKFHPAQCGFRGFRSVETAILRVTRAVMNGCRFLCVLDLRQAYASVPRGDLVNRIEGLVDTNVAKMIECMLYRTVVTTVRDQAKMWRAMERGVPEGSPLSPSLFNFFIDPVASLIDEEVAGGWSNPLNLFADDIILMAPSAPSMQRLLNVCQDFAAANGLQWGLNKCHAIAAPGATQAELFLDGEALSYVRSAEYLGVDIDGQGVTDAATLERLCKASARIEQLKASGIRRPRVSMERLQRVYGALIRPMWTYAVHLAPFSHQLERAAADFLDKVTAWVYPKLPAHSRKRARRLLAIEDADVRRSMQMQGMVGRMQTAHQEALEEGDPAEIGATAEDAQSAMRALEDETILAQPSEAQRIRWKAVEDSRNRIRKVADSDGLELHPLWQLPTTRHATCAANWCFGRFPKNREAARLYLGGRPTTS